MHISALTDCGSNPKQDWSNLWFKQSCRSGLSTNIMTGLAKMSSQVVFCYLAVSLDMYIYIIGNLGETTRANKNHASLLFVICAYELLSLQPLTSTSLKWHILFQSGHDKEFGTKRQIVLTCGWNYPCRFPENLTWKRESKAKNRGEQHISRLDACFWLIEGNNPWRPCFFCIIWRVFLSCLPFKTICTFAYAPCMECFLRYMIHVFFLKQNLFLG